MREKKTSPKKGERSAEDQEILQTPDPYDTLSESPPSDENELSAEDLAILAAFDEKEDWADVSALSEGEAAPLPPSMADTSPQDDLLAVFVSEVNEDIDKVNYILSQLEQDEHIDPTRFVALKRVAHKIRGTSGAVECLGMATVAGYMEVIAEKITEGMLFPVIGLNALLLAAPILQEAAQHVAQYREEGDLPLTELEEAIKSLNIDLEQSEQENQKNAVVTAGSQTAITQDLVHDTATPLAHVEVKRLEHLMQCSEQLAELLPPLENISKQTTDALRELCDLQRRMQRVVPTLPSLLMRHDSLTKTQSTAFSSPALHRMLYHTTTQDSGYHGKSDSSFPQKQESAQWDELDLERYDEQDLLIRSLNETITNSSVAATRLESLFTTMLLKQQEFLAQVATMHNATLLLRLVPLKFLVTELRSIITSETHVQFEVKGEDVEVDQSILVTLTSSLIQMMHMCITHATPEQGPTHEPYRVWFYAQSVGNEVTIEIGFSMTVGGGALEAIHEPLQRLNGTYSLQRNATGGVSFYLRFPRARGTAARCLLVRVGSQELLVPFAQVQRIGITAQEQLDVLYELHTLLGFSSEEDADTGMKPVLVLPQAVSSHRVIGISVDAVVDEVETVVKSLTPYLQRPGIAGITIDGNNKVLLMLDLPTLVWHAMTQHRYEPIEHEPSSEATQYKILVADDSLSLRQSVVQTLRQAHYQVIEARDGMEALEKLLEEDIPPDLFLLDIEMPNLNGYDLLSIMSLYPELAHVKVVMLSSRSSEKHIQRARELGAHVYLTKPCARDTLLKTIQTLLKD